MLPSSLYPWAKNFKVRATKDFFSINILLERICFKQKFATVASNEITGLF